MRGINKVLLIDNEVKALEGKLFAGDLSYVYLRRKNILTALRLIASEESNSNSILELQNRLRKLLKASGCSLATAIIYILSIAVNHIQLLHQLAPLADEDSRNGKRLNLNLYSKFLEKLCLFSKLNYQLRLTS